MPSRAACLAVIAFWLATAGWFTRREIWPALAAGAAPPYVIELADEAMRQAVPVTWSVHRGGEPLTHAITRVEYDEVTDRFNLSCDVRKFDALRTSAVTVEVKSMRSHYRVNRTGELVGTEAEVALGIGPATVRFQLAAQVRDGRAWPSCRVESPWGTFEPPVEPVPVTAAGFLNPLHPVGRVLGLRVGQTWTQSFDDPLGDALRVSLERMLKDATGLGPLRIPQAAPRTLVAEVIGPRPLAWRNAEHDCLVIVYRGDDYSARTFVRVADGLVLRQEATGGGEDLALQRN